MFTTASAKANEPEDLSAFKNKKSHGPSVVQVWSQTLLPTGVNSKEIK